MKSVRLLTVLSCLLLLALATACAAPAAPAQPAPAAATEPTAVPAAPTAAAPAADQIVLKHWYHQYGEEGTYEAALRYAAEYSKVNPNVKVEVTWVPGDYFAALNAALLTAEGPDVFELQTVDLARVRAEQVADLTSLFPEEIKTDFNAAALQRATVDGKIYGIPMIVDPQFVYYRKSMLKDAGVDAPTTMDELIAATKKLDTGRVKGLYLGNDMGSTTYLLYMTTFAAGADLITDANKVGFNTDQNVTMWQKRLELAQSGSLLVGATTEWWDPGALNDGLVAMQYCGLWAMPGIIKALGADEVGVMPWPAVDATTEPSVFVGGWNQSVNAKSKHLEAAKAYAKWLWIENAEAQKDWNLSYGFHIPPRKSTAATATPLQSGPAAEVVKMMDAYGQTTPITWTGAMDSIYVDASAQVLLKNGDPATELTKAAEAVQKELDALLAGK